MMSWLLGALAIASIVVFVLASRRSPAKQKEEAVSGPGPDHLFGKRQRLLKIVEECEGAPERGTLLCGDLMSSLLATVTPMTRVGHLKRQMVEQRLRHFLVCDGTRRLIGIVSDRDLYQRHGTTVAEIMTRNPLTVRSSTPVMQAITLMLQRNISCVPVTEGEEGKLLGVVTTTDILLTLQCFLQMDRRAALQA